MRRRTINRTAIYQVRIIPNAKESIWWQNGGRELFYEMIGPTYCGTAIIEGRRLNEFIVTAAKIPGWRSNARPIVIERMTSTNYI